MFQDLYAASLLHAGEAHHFFFPVSPSELTKEREIVRVFNLMGIPFAQTDFLWFLQWLFICLGSLAFDDV